MKPLSPAFAPDLVALMGRACDEVWQELCSRHRFAGEEDEVDARQTVAERVLAAVSDGEPDLEKIKKLAISSALRRSEE
jgi:hypothetical protein